MTKRTRQETETHEPEPDINLQTFGLSASDILDAVSADLPEEQLDETPEPTSFGPQPWEYAPAAKATGALEKLNDLARLRPFIFEFFRIRERRFI